jgi:putative FmdB family regulatory protein
MPIYEYLCRNCGYTFEELQSMKEEPLVKCPNCGMNELQKLIGTGGGVIFKGSGFYQTDYKKSGSSAKKHDQAVTKSGSKSTASETKTGSKSETKTETKTDTKTEPKKESKKDKKNK